MALTPLMPLMPRRPAGPTAVTVTLNPALDQTLSIPGFAVGRVNRVVESRIDPGGKGVNVASFLTDLGADLGLSVIVTGFLGAENQEIFEQFFAAKDITDHFVRVGGPTRAGIKVVDPRTQQTTDINFPGITPEAQHLDELFRRIAELAAPGRWFVLGGSVPAGVADDIYARLIDAIHAGGGHAVLDTSGRPLLAALESRPEVMKPNIDELRELSGRPLATLADACEAGRSLLARGVGRVVVSMGGDGALFLDPGEALLARPPRVAVRSTVGAGDAMVGGIVDAVLRGLPLAEVARRGTACGAYAVTRIGAGVDDPADIQKLMGQIVIESLAIED